MPQVPFVDLTAQYETIKEEISASIQAVLSQCNFILGSHVEEFEKSFAAFAAVKHAVGVASGLDALRLGLMSLDIGSGDEVLLPANTFIATALAVSATGATPVLVDCDPGTYNIDVSLIERSITPRTRAIIPVHLAGQSADMDPILAIADKWGLYVIEDAAQAHGALYKGRPCGSVGHVGCFSFYPGKNLGAYGDGGMVVTNDAARAKRLRMLRNYGQEVKYEHLEKGLNSRLDTLQAAVLQAKLPHLGRWNQSRAAHAETYREELTGAGDLTFQQRVPYSNHVYHLFIVETESRDDLKRYLSERGVQVGIHYPVPIHLQKAYADLGYEMGSFPQSERLARRALSLPMYPEMQRDQILYTTGLIHQFFDTRAEEKTNGQPCAHAASERTR